MDVTPLIPADRYVIDGYGAGGIRVRGVLYSGPVLIFPDKVLPWPKGRALATLTPEDFSLVLGAEDKPEVLLLGVGAVALELPPKAVREACRAAGVVVEVMDTGAACRTYNVLLAEGRRVAALLALPV